MFPATAVIGRPGEAQPVGVYALKAYRVDPSDAVAGFATNLGFSASPNGVKTLCFTVPAKDSAAPAAGRRRLRQQAGAPAGAVDVSGPLNVNWAHGASSALAVHTDKGSAVLSLQGGGAAAAGAGGPSAERAAAVLIAHGALMAAAFLLLMPAAAIAARHKWLSGAPDATVGGRVRGGWFQAHRSMQILALMAAITAFIIIFQTNGWLPGGPGFEIFSAHRALGIATFALALAQGALGAARPALGAAPSPRRLRWYGAHAGLGWSVIALGTVTCYLGIATLSTLGTTQDVMSAWLGPALAVTSTLLLLGGALELRKWRLQASGRYDPLTHQVHAPGHVGKAGIPITAAAPAGAAA
jgi:cytochrome b561